MRTGSPSGRGGGRASAALPLLDDVPHRLRRGALHLPIRRSRQNVNLFLRSPLTLLSFPFIFEMGRASTKQYCLGRTAEHGRICYNEKQIH
jgi:hypothetical protein